MKKLSNILIIVSLILLSGVGIKHFELSEYLTKLMSEQKGTDSVAEIKIEPKRTKTKISYKNHLDKGDLRFQNGYNTLAIAEYTEATKLEPSLPDAYIKIGKVHFSEKNFTKALENFRIASQTDPEHVESKILIGITYINLSEFDKAEKIFNAVTAENAKLYYYRGLLNILYKQYEDAKFNLEKAIKTDSEGTIKNGAGKVLGAFATFIVSEGAQETYRRTLLAKALSEVNEHNLAIQVVYDVLEENPQYRDAWIILGYSYLNLEKYFDAISSLEKALEIDPSKPETLYFLGITQKKQGEYGASINSLEIAVRNGFEPRTMAYKELAESYMKNEEYEKAVMYYEKLIEADKTNMDAFIKAIWIYIDFIGNPGKAEEIAKTAISANPESALSYNLLGWAKTSSGDMEGAKDNLEKALEIDENLAAAYLNLGIWYERQGNLVDAKTNYKRAYELEKGTGVGEKALNMYNATVKKEAEKSTQATPSVMEP